MLKVELSGISHRGKPCIAIIFPYNFELKEYVKSFPGVYWSSSKRCFYFYYSELAQREFITYMGKCGYLVHEKNLTEAVSVVHKHRKARIDLPHLPREKIAVHKNFVMFLYGKRYSESTVQVYSGFILEFLRFSAEKPTDQL